MDGVESEPPRPNLAWAAHPFRRRRTRGTATLAVMIGAAVAIGAWMGSPVWGVFTFGVLFLSLESFFLPTRYEMREEGLAVNKKFSNSTFPWTGIRRVYEDGQGLTLSPYRRRTFLEPYRSARVLFDGGDRELIRREVRERCAAAEWIQPAARKGS